MARRRNKSEERDIAEARIARLLALARAESHGPDADLSDRYADLARRIAMRYQVGLGPAGRSAVCRECGAFRVPGRTSRTRVQSGRIVTTCLKCGAASRRPVHPKTTTFHRATANPTAHPQPGGPRPQRDPPRSPSGAHGARAEPAAAPLPAAPVKAPRSPSSAARPLPPAQDGAAQPGGRVRRTFTVPAKPKVP